MELRESAMSLEAGEKLIARFTMTLLLAAHTLLKLMPSTALVAELRVTVIKLLWRRRA